MGDVENGGAVPTTEQLLARIAELEGAKNTNPGVDGITFKVGEKGGVSVLGLQRFPVTLYLDQWRKLLSGPVQDALIEFLGEHEEQLKPKPLVKSAREKRSDAASAVNGAGITLSKSEVEMIPGMLKRYEGNVEATTALMTLQACHELNGKVTFEPYSKFRALVGK